MTDGNYVGAARTLLSQTGQNLKPIPVNKLVTKALSHDVLCSLKAFCNALVSNKLAGIGILSICFLNAAYANDLATADVSQLNIDINQTSVSGLSSGGYMATQFQLAHSDTLAGAGIIGAGPYYCALGSINIALGQCVGQSSSSITNAPFFAKYEEYLEQGKVAPSAALSKHRVMLIHGKLDTTVNRVAADLLAEQYRTWLPSENFVYIDDKAFAHHMPTANFGSSCELSEAPFLGNCGFDAAGEILSFIYGVDSKKQTAANSTLSSTLMSINIDKLADLGGTSIADEAFIYIPSACQTGESCRLHVSFHGCNQSAEDVGSTYAEHSGFNTWADKNHTVVLYPQVEKSMFMPLNPQACWDWWGYTDENYANKEGKQVKAIYELIKSLSDTSQY